MASGSFTERDGTNSKEQKSFITSTEEVCYFTASVGYDGNQGDSVSPIDPSKVTWSVEKPSHGMELDGELQGNWSGAKHPSKLDPSTSFNVVGKLKVPQHKGTSKSHCPNYGGTSTPRNGRADTPMTFTIKFSAKTEDGQEITPVALVLLQDEKDEMRQEYMDMARKTTRRKGSVDGNVLRVPSRSELGSQNTYDDGHYSYMMGRTILPKKHTKWTAAFKKHAKETFGNTGLSDLVETGGYRNPHHHYYHVPNGSGSPRGWHQFGLALDVRGKDIDINKDKKKGTLTDRKEIAEAAELYAGASWTKHTYSDGHVHAQWEWEGSNKERASTSTSGKFSLPAQGTDAPLVVEKQAEKKLLPCGHREGTPGNHRKMYCGFCSAPLYACDKSYTHGPVKCPKNSKGETCTVDEGWMIACEAHVHKYPSDTPKEAPPHAHSSVVGHTPHADDTLHIHWLGFHEHDGYPSHSHSTGVWHRHSTSTDSDTDDDSDDDSDDDPTDVPRRPTPKETPPKETLPKETQPQTRPRAVCSAGHTYNSDRSAAVSRHSDRTCTRCSLTYQNCTNHSSACQGSKWHTEDPSAAPRSPTTTPPTTPTTPSTTPTTPSSDDDDDTSVPQAPSQPQVTYHACGVHRSSVSGDHSLQASCSTDSKCIATSFYQCMHLLHKYATPPPRTPTDTPRRPKTPDPPPSATCSAGHTYNPQTSWLVNRHKDRTCSRCSQTYQNCTNSSSACQGSKWHTDQAIQTPPPPPPPPPPKTPTTVKCARSACGETVSHRLAHKVTVCSAGCGNSYWTCIDGAVGNHETTYECRRPGCGKTFTKCTNGTCNSNWGTHAYHWAK